jgi:hypothetical protein
LLQNKYWVSFSPIGRTTNLRKLSVTLNTQDASPALVLICHGKHGFSKDSTRYKKCDRYKKSLEEKIEDKVNTLFENRFMAFIENLSQEHGSALLHLLAPQATNLSSMGSTTGLVTWYLMDDITIDTHCRLHIPLGRVGNKTKEVANVVAMPEHVFHDNPIPVEYARVLV